MTSSWVIAASLTYLCLLFGIAFVVDRYGARALPRAIPEAWIFALSLAVYSTAWTFYGSVGMVAGTGGDYIPLIALDLGPILVITLAQPFLRKLLRVCKAQHVTSLADLIAARYSKRQDLAALTAAIVVIGVIPYISLQLKAISDTFDILTKAGGLATAASALDTSPTFSPGGAPIYNGTSLPLTLLMAGFVILFGTRKIDATEQHHGMVATIAFESIVKLMALLAVGVFVTYGVFDGFADLAARAHARPDLAPLITPLFELEGSRLWSLIMLTALSAMAFLCLPRQFQVMVVENTQIGHLRTAAWLFPLYLIVLNLFVLPIALAGLLSPSQTGVRADSYVLTLPLASGAPGLALLAFIGGFSAATSMIIVETIALSTMISNALILPMLIRGRRLNAGAHDSVVGLVKWVRRSSIVAILLLAYIYARLVGHSYALSGIGQVSFVAVAQFAPMIVGGLYWRQAHWRGAWWGLIAGCALWSYTLVLPSFAESGWLPHSFIDAGPMGMTAIKPYALLGLSGLDRITHGMLWSLGANALIYVTLSLLCKQNRDDRAHAILFVDATAPINEREFTARIHWHDLAHVLKRFLGDEAAQRALAAYAHAHHIPLEGGRLADGEIVSHTEKLVAGAVGSSLARVVVAAVTRERQENMAGVMDLLSEASEQIEMQWERLREAIQNIDQGLAMFDADLRLVVWNERFLNTFTLPPSLGAVGTPIEALVRASRPELPETELDALVATTLQRAHSRETQRFEHSRPDGRVFEVYEKPLADGGLISTFSDITERKRAEKALHDAKTNLEQIVDQRTAEARRSEERFRDFAESASDWFWECDAALRLTYLSERAAQCLGRPTEQIIGLPLVALAERQAFSPEALQKHGADLASHRPFAGVDYPVQRSSDELGYMRLSGKPVFANDAIFLGYRGTANDITTLVHAQHELVRQEKMAALGGLVAGVAHEINTPVGISITATSFLQERMREFSTKYATGQMKRSDLEAFIATTEESLASLSTNLQRAATMVRSFKQVAVDQSSDARRVFNVREYIGEILDSLRPRLKRTPHKITIECPEELEIESFPGAWSQILSNLIINSLQHGLTAEKEGHIAISVVPAARNLVITYRDDGCGMPTELAKRIFDPFFTTRRGEGGSGLGMHIVYNLVTQQLAGQIACTTAPGKGISFTMNLPLSTEATHG